ncbi:RNase P subunit p30 [Colletotrichum graminicola]|uniref:RNase P subunit p30 n=1 Tax=Colletotrichum graminicola (strain M1.001 / M2 / FGSC 10212) TaxID=645133 RepID=E3QAE2_COLGM|nr:RNase P subunit p30 [Colletotrichum graminicola M1.001]EFQ27830.1 RNase P subunit p30 [Colletotrichum graminicola M1.001]WDK11462.1 RNase P subunit p30 [Colletotrichum graminicola]
MLYDLNIPWSPATTPADLSRTISFASSLGYTVLALNHTITPPIPSQITNPLPKFPSSASAAAPSQPPQQKSPRPTVLHRVTVVLSDPSQNYRLAALAAAYDLLAVRPTTEKAFQAACLSMAEPSLISLDLTQHFPFHFRPKPLMAAVSRGVRFEVCYAQVLGAPDARARATFISNLASLVRATKGRGVVVGSEARSALGLRAPNDVVNLLAVWGLASEKATEALGANPRGVVVNEGIKRSGFRGVVNVLEIGGREEDAQKQKQKQQQQQQGKKDGGKGKGDKGTKQGGGGSEDRGNGQKRKTPDEAGDGAPQTMSKRQAKKLRLALKEKEKDAA